MTRTKEMDESSGCDGSGAQLCGLFDRLHLGRLDVVEEVVCRGQPTAKTGH
jgi:hypothetical protein